MVFVTSAVTHVGDYFQGTHNFIRSFIAVGANIQAAKQAARIYLNEIKKLDLLCMHELDPGEYDSHDYAIVEETVGREWFVSLIRREGYESVELERCVIEQSEIYVNLEE